MRWPLVRRSTYEATQTELWSARQRAADLGDALAAAQIEIHRLKMVLAGRSGVIRVARNGENID
jgi:hypothetical protein